MITYIKYLKILCICIACLLFGGNIIYKQANARVITNEPPVSKNKADDPIETVAAIQVSPESADSKNSENRHQQIANQIVDAANKGSRYVILPELAVTGSLTETAQDIINKQSETIPGPTTRFFADYARKLNIFLALTILEKTEYGEGYYLTAVLLDEKGEIRIQRRKVAPRIGGGDGANFVRGNPRTILESYDNGNRRIGLISGDDLQAGVPRLANRGASVIFISANLSDNEVVDWDETCRKLAREQRVTLVVANSNSEGKKIRGTYLSDGSKAQSIVDEPNYLALAQLPASQNSAIETQLGLPSVPLPTNLDVTPEMVELGRTLFFDKGLSRNETVSCASCHRPERAFSNGRNTGIGIEGNQTQRNVPSLLNVAFRGALFWDGYASTLESQSKYPMTHASEMGSHYLDLVEKINAKPSYISKFKKIFGREKIEFDDVSAALATYQRTLISGDSRFDRYFYGKESNAITPAEKRGLELFTGKANCAACHQIQPKYALFMDQNFHNTGVGFNSKTKTFADLGHGAISYEGKSGLFFTPSLRNVGQTGPYMHDGSIKTLEEVIEFYNRGGNNNPYLDSVVKPLNLNTDEVKDLVAFLRSLNGNSSFDAVGRPQPIDAGGQKTLAEKKDSGSHVAAIQFSPTPGKFRANTIELAKLIRSAVKNGAKYVVLPEYALTGKLTSQNITADQAKTLAESSLQDAKTRLSTLSRELKVWLIIPVLESDKESKQIFSTHFVWNDSGKLVHHQRKLSPLNEAGDQYISRGHFKNIQSIHTKDGLIGVVSGNDLVQGARRLAELGAKTILVSAAWSANEVFDYEAECRELAQEFKVNIVISNLKEKNPDTLRYGKIWDYSGKVFAEDKQSGNSIIYGSLNAFSNIDYLQVTPLGLPQVPQPANRRITKEAVALGRELFFDAELSRDGSISCATCHTPTSGFADNQRVSTGLSGRLGKMNVPTVLNTAYRPFLGWEGRATSLEEQILRAMHGFPELDMSKEEMVIRLNQSEKYRKHFQQITGKAEIEITDVVNVLADYQRTLLAGNSPFDRFYYAAEKNAISEKAKRGFELFRGKANCVTCHQINEDFGLFADFDFHNTGVGYQKRFEYLGYAGDGLEGNPATKNAFRGEYFTPSLRNVVKTAPYMHDGSVATLEDVIRFYNAGGIKNPFLDHRVKPLMLTKEEQSSLVEFLRSLTSESLAESEDPSLALKN